MPTPDFLSNDFSHPHHRRSIAIMIVTVLIFGLLIVGYMYKQTPDVTLDPILQPTTQSQVVSNLNQSSSGSVSNADKATMVQRMSQSSSGLSNAQKAEIISQLQTP